VLAIHSLTCWSVRSTVRSYADGLLIGGQNLDPRLAGAAPVA